VSLTPSALIAILSMIGSVGAWLAAKHQADTSDAALRLARESYQQSLRPYVAFEKVEIRERDVGARKIVIGLAMKNYGGLAEYVRLTGTVQIVTGERAESNDLTKQGSEVRILAPGGENKLQMPVSIKSQEAYTAIERGDSRLEVELSLTYKGQFMDKPKVHAYRYRYQPHEDFMINLRDDLYDSSR